MQTTDKALSLLKLFTESRPQLGLSALARLATFDKATTRRLLVSLMRNGLIEQHPDTKQYRLGAGILSLARVREETFPVARQVRPVLQTLVEATGETTHFSMFSGSDLSTIEKVDSPKAIRVIVSYSDSLPLHCTASGIAYLSYQPDDIVDNILSDKLIHYTPKTITDVTAIKKTIITARSLGYSHIDSGFELDVVGVAAAVFDWSGRSCGAVAVATPSSRMHASQFELTRNAVRDAAIKITRAFGSAPAAAFLKTA